MYDTLKFNLKKQDCICKVNHTFCDNIDYIQNCIKHYDIDNEIEYFTGKLSNLSIYVNDNNICIEGSLAKYFYGNNLKTLNIDDTKRAIEKLSDELHLSIEKATITRIDFGTNFIMQNRPSDYYQFLGLLSRFARSNIEENTLYYIQNNKCLCFYDKGIESKLENIPSEYRNKNILRYELRFTRRLVSTFNMNKITASLLYNVDFYNTLIEQYKSYYNSINKSNNNTLDINNIRSKSDFYNFATQYVINHLNYNTLMNGIKEQQHRNKLTNRQAHDLRILISNNSHNETSIIEELTEKINFI
jgi:hypothetical protein